MAKQLFDSEPYRSAPAYRASQLPSEAPYAPTEPDCDAAETEADREACGTRELNRAKTGHEQLLAKCKKLLPASQEQELAAQERMWRIQLESECTAAPCLSEGIRRRDAGISQAFPLCGVEDRPVARLAVHESKTGMLPAQWTPAKGASHAVPFTFETKNATSGEMSTTLGKGGETFHGSYVRVEKSTKGKLVTTIYNGWSSPEWETWEHDPDGGWTATGVSFGEFARFYSGKVIATQKGDRGSTMRCTWH